jgi:hypothetical protein
MKKNNNSFGFNTQRKPVRERKNKNKEEVVAASGGSVREP